MSINFGMENFSKYLAEIIFFLRFLDEDWVRSVLMWIQNSADLVR